MKADENSGGSGWGAAGHVWERISDTLWEIPASFKEGMRVPARIYATEKLLQAMDEAVYEQVTNVATLPGITQYALCMPDGAIADIAFRAWGRSLEEVFISAGDATMNVMIDNLESIEFKEQRPLRLANSALDMLLFELLQELIYHKDAGQLLLRVRQVQIGQGDGEWTLTGKAEGEKLDPARHHQRADVKAVTLHHFKLEKVEQSWRASVILDI